MKKLFLAVALVAMVGLCSSCNKEKTCACTYTVDVLGVETTFDLGETVISSGSCSDLEDPAVWEGVEGTISCEQI